jgi:murein lipoprotein
MNKKLLIVGVIAGSALLAGCSNTAESEESKEAMNNLTNQVSELSSKVDMLAADHDAMKAETQAAKDDAASANARVDAIAESYKK